MTHITVYSKPNCVQCTATKRALDKAGLIYEVIDISTDDQARDQLAARGFQSAPVVFAGDDSWSGFRPERIKELGKALTAVA